MPFVHIRLLGVPLATATIRHLQAEATRLMAECLAKRADLTAVLVEEMRAETWSVGGAPVSNGAHLDALITAGTNSAEDKARFIAAAHALLAGVAEDALPLATYVALHEIAADAWGYAGLPQAARRLAAA